MTAPHVSEDARDSVPGALLRDVDAYVRQLAEVSSRAGGAAEPAAQATAWAEAHRVSAWGLRAAVSAARDQGLSWRELAELLDVPAATLHRQYRAGQSLAIPGASPAEPAPAAPPAVQPAPPPAAEPALPPAAEPALPPAAAVPAGIDLFVGRDRALADAPALLAHGRLLTLAGPGGVGKTRLASELAHRIRGSYRGGVLWAELAPVAPGSAESGQGGTAGIEAAIAAAAGPEGHSKRIGGLLATACEDGPVLLVLDNCEHLVDGAARTASALLIAHPLLRILATSREPLRIAGETILPVRPLTDEPAGPRGGPPPAVRLFNDRARAASADFDPDAHASAIAELCEQLDGLPLAIELAARQIAVLPPETLLSRLAERLDLLSGGARNAPRRQQSLRAAIEWSYQLLDPTEQAVFRRLAVLPGGFDQRTAAAVTADLGLSRAALWGLLATLASKSLTAADPRTPGRYRMLESLRAYGGEELDAGKERAAVHDQLLGWYAALATEMYSAFASRNALLAGWAAERDNLHYATAIAEAEHDPRYPRLANLTAALWNWNGELSRVQRLLSHVLTTTTLTPLDRMVTLQRLSVSAADSGDGPLAIRYATECLNLARSGGDTVRAAEALNALTNAHVLIGDAATSIALIREHLPMIRSIPQHDHLCLTLGNLAWYLLATGQPAAAQSAVDEALALDETNLMTVAIAAISAITRGDATTATSHATRALASTRPGHKQLLDLCEVLATAAAERGDTIRALRLFAAAAATRRRDGITGNPWWIRCVTAAATAARASAPASVVTAATAEGAALSVEATIAYALHDTLPHHAPEAGSPLTIREQHVAELVAQGYTNAQIAARLYISARTVATHLTHIRSKLDLPSRVHIAAWVNDHKT